MTKKLLFTAVAALFLAATVWRINQHLTGAEPPGATSLIVTGVVAMIALACVLGTIALFRYRANIDDARNSLQVRTLRTKTMSLDQPTTVTVAREQKKNASGQNTTAVWKATFERGSQRLTVDEPYVENFSAFLTSLQPAVAKRPDLAKDERTRTVIQNPSSL